MIRGKAILFGEECFLTPGKIYDYFVGENGSVHVYHGDKYVSIYDTVGYFKSEFVMLEDYRNQKIDEILK